MKRFKVVLAPRVAADVEQHLNRLRSLEAEGTIASGYAEKWYAMFEETLTALIFLAERHPFAPEREPWGREVRNALFADYRILYLVVPNDVVWVMRVRHQRDVQLRRGGRGTAPPR